MDIKFNYNGDTEITLTVGESFTVPTVKVVDENEDEVTDAPTVNLVVTKDGDTVTDVTEGSALGSETGVYVLTYSAEGLDVLVITVKSPAHVFFFLLTTVR